jgi:hypothetical protein
MSETYTILCGKYISYIFHVFSEARDHILILNILFFNKLRQIIPAIRSERRDLLIFIFILKTTGTFTPVHSAGYLILPGRIYKCHFTECDNAGEPSQEGRGFSPSGGVQIARELNITG